MKNKEKMFDLPPKCPALADKLTGLFGWRHTYKVHQRQKGIAHFNYNLQKTYSLNLPPKNSGKSGSTGSLSGRVRTFWFVTWIVLYFT
jgi:hypothetical protein